MAAVASSESEYVALAEVVNELRFLRQVKGFLMPPIDDNIVIREENEGAIKMATNRYSSRRTRHVDVNHHIVRDAVESGVVQIHYVKSGEQHTDVLTKALDANTFETHARFLLNARAGSATSRMIWRKKSDMSMREGLIKIAQSEPLTGVQFERHTSVKQERVFGKR